MTQVELPKAKSIASSVLRMGLLDYIALSVSGCSERSTKQSERGKAWESHFGVSGRRRSSPITGTIPPTLTHLSVDANIPA